MKNLKIYTLKKKAGKYLVKHRKKTRIAKAAIFSSIYLYLKFALKIDCDAIFIVVAIWFISEIRN